MQSFLRYKTKTPISSWSKFGAREKAMKAFSLKGSNAETTN
jgi:hypothetical protein